MHQSLATFVNSIPDFLIRERLEAFLLSDLLPEGPKVLHGSPHGIQRFPAFGDYSGYSLVVSLLRVRRGREVLRNGSWLPRRSQCSWAGSC
jgi:hypothetical protein